MPTSDVTATDDRDVNAEIDISLVALTLDAEGRVTSAVADMAEPALTVSVRWRHHCAGQGGDQVGTGRPLRDAGRFLLK